MHPARLVLCAAACVALARAQTDPEAAGFDLNTQHEDVFTPEPSRVFMPFNARAQTDPEAAGFDLNTQREDVFTPEPSRVFMPFYVPGWTNGYVPNVPETCRGAIVGFADVPLSDADCHASFQFLLERGTRRVRYGCFKCAGAFQVTPAAAPYATCDGKPICSALPLAYYRCFLKNDPTNDIFSCLMDVDYQSDK